MIGLLVPHLLPILQSSQGDGSGGPILLVAGPVVGVAMYGAVYRYYRNADKSDQFERDTRIALKDPVAGEDRKVDEVRGTRKQHIDGDNSRRYRQRVDRME